MDVSKAVAVRDGIDIMLRNGMGECDVAAEHDILYAGPDSVPKKHYSAEDRKQLKKLGWSWDDDNCCWSIFV